MPGQLFNLFIVLKQFIKTAERSFRNSCQFSQIWEHAPLSVVQWAMQMQCILGFAVIYVGFVHPLHFKNIT